MMHKMAAVESPTLVHQQAQDYRGCMHLGGYLPCDAQDEGNRVCIRQSVGCFHPW